jgi:hypothetical protein
VCSNSAVVLYLLLLHLFPYLPVPELANKYIILRAVYRDRLAAPSLSGLVAGVFRLHILLTF